MTWRAIHLTNCAKIKQIKHGLLIHKTSGDQHTSAVYQFICFGSAQNGAVDRTGTQFECKTFLSDLLCSLPLAEQPAQVPRIKIGFDVSCHTVPVNSQRIQEPVPHFRRNLVPHMQ